MWPLSGSCVFGHQALQSVGNLGLQLGHGKEQWMAPLHPIILRSVASVKDFLDKLIDIDHDIGKDDDSKRTPAAREQLPAAIRIKQNNTVVVKYS